MSFMRKSDTLTLTTPLPNSLSPPQLLQTLHSHPTLIGLDKSAEQHTLTTGNAGMSAEYSVVAKKSFGKTTYEYAITNKNDGVDTETSAHPPPGLLKIWSKFRVGDGVLREEVRLEGSRLILGKVKGSVESEHKEWHQRLFEVAGEGA